MVKVPAESAQSEQRTKAVAVTANRGGLNGLLGRPSCSIHPSMILMAGP